MSETLATCSNRLILALACAAPMVAACGGDPADDLVGTWSAVDDNGQVGARFTFGDDGSYEFEEFDDAQALVQNIVGTFTADGTVLALDGVDADTQDRVIESANYFVDGPLLSVGVLLADGDVDGVFGNWVGSSSLQVVDSGGTELDNTTLDTELELRADNTGTFTQTAAPDMTVTVEGALQDLGDDAFVFSFTVGDPPITVNIAFDLLGGEALSGATFELDESAELAAPRQGALSRAGTSPLVLSR